MNLHSPNRDRLINGQLCLNGIASMVPNFIITPLADGQLQLTCWIPTAYNSYVPRSITIPEADLPAHFSAFRDDPEAYFTCHFAYDPTTFRHRPPPLESTPATSLLSSIINREPPPKRDFTGIRRI